MDLFLEKQHYNQFLLKRLLFVHHPIQSLCDQNHLQYKHYCLSDNCQLLVRDCQPHLILADPRLYFHNMDYIEEYNPNASTTGLPQYYAIFDVDNFILAPTPDQAYSVELHYYYRPNSLTAGADSGSTWLSTNAPFAMLYGSLIEAYTFMKGEPDIMQLYATRYQEALKELKELGEGYDTTDNYRSGSVRQVRQ